MANKVTKQNKASVAVEKKKKKKKNYSDYIPYLTSWAAFLPHTPYCFINVLWLANNMNIKPILSQIKHHYVFNELISLFIPCLTSLAAFLSHTVNHFIDILQAAGKNFRRKLKVFLFFLQNRFDTSCKRQFVWSVKSYFLGKIIKKYI